MPVIHYFKSKKTQKVSGAFNGFLQVLIMQIMQSHSAETLPVGLGMEIIQLVPD